MQNITNQGIMISGNGVLNAQQVIGGENGKIETISGSGGLYNDYTIDRLQRELSDLLVRIKSESKHLPPDAIKGVETVTEEVNKATPNKLVVTSVLDSVAKLVTSFGTLSGSIIAVKDIAATVLK